MPMWGVVGHVMGICQIKLSLWQSTRHVLVNHVLCYEYLMLNLLHNFDVFYSNISSPGRGFQQKTFPTLCPTSPPTGTTRCIRSLDAHLKQPLKCSIDEEWVCSIVPPWRNLFQQQKVRVESSFLLCKTLTAFQNLDPRLIYKSFRHYFLSSMQLRNPPSWKWIWARVVSSQQPPWAIMMVAYTTYLENKPH